MKILDLGCGKAQTMFPYAKITRIDKVDVPGSIQWDLEKTPLPFKDNEFDIVVAFHVLEHIKNFIPLMKEIYRILKTDGMFLIKVPYFNSINAWGDITHVRNFTYRSFECFKKNDFWHYELGDGMDFETVSRKLVFSTDKLKFLNLVINPIVNKFHAFYEKFPYILPCSELQIVLRKR